MNKKNMKDQDPKAKKDIDNNEENNPQETKKDNEPSNKDTNEEEIKENHEERLNKELIETKEKWLRLAAEFENYKKISRREFENRLKFASEPLVMSLLPAIDNLEKAVMAGKNAESKEAKDLVMGVSMVLKQIKETLGNYFVESFSAEGEEFDPNLHEAVSEKVCEEKKEGMVIEEFQKGYKMHDRLLRPARVAVSKKPNEANNEPQE